METTQKPISEMTADELRAALAQKEASEKKNRLNEKEAYEKERDSNVRHFVAAAIMLNQQLTVYKTSLAKMMEGQHEKLSQYGGIRSSSKGGFNLTTTDGTMRITRTRSTRPEWDERSEKAIELIQSFLEETVKKKDKKLFEILITFIARDKEGNLEYDKVMSLIQHRDKYDDPRWIEGLDLILESYRLNLTGFGYDLFVRNSEEKWERVDLTFPSIQINTNETTEENETV